MLSRIAESLVLAGALYRTRRRYRAHSRRELPHAARAIPAVLPAALGAADRHGRRGRTVSEALRRSERRKRFRVPGVSRGQSELHRAVHRQGSRKRAHHSRPHFPGNVGGHQRPVSHGQPFHPARRRSPPGRTASATRSNSARTAFTASPTRRCRTTKAGNSCASAGRSSARR